MADSLSDAEAMEREIARRYPEPSDRTEAGDHAVKGFERGWQAHHDFLAARAKEDYERIVTEERLLSEGSRGEANCIDGYVDERPAEWQAGWNAASDRLVQRVHAVRDELAELERAFDGEHALLIAAEKERDEALDQLERGVKMQGSDADMRALLRRHGRLR